MPYTIIHKAQRLSSRSQQGFHGEISSQVLKHLGAWRCADVRPRGDRTISPVRSDITQTVTLFDNIYKV